MSKLISELSPYISSHARFCTIIPKTALYLPFTGTFYAVFDDYGTTLRACRILSVLYGETIGETFLQVKVAGVGKGYVAANARFFRNSDDFLAGKRFAPLSEENGVFFIEDHIMRDVDVRLNTCAPVYRFHFYRYAWDDNKVAEVGCYVKAEYFVAGNYLNIDFEPISYLSWEGKKTYLSKSDCIRDNKVDVADFDDDNESKTYDVTIEVIKTVTTTIKATSKESVVKAARTLFGDKDIKVSIDGEVEYEHRKI